MALVGAMQEADLRGSTPEAQVTENNLAAVFEALLAEVVVDVVDG